jgi:alpha-amylase
MQRKFSWVILSFAAISATACLNDGVPTEVDASSNADATTAPDAGFPEADAGSPSPDAGTPTPDAGVAPADAGPARPVTVDVTGTFAAGTTVRDGYSGRTAVVGADGKVTVDADPSGVILLERDASAATPFSWDNATVYFVITDRYFNGDPLNDHAYGRLSDGAQEVGTFHGGDFQGLRQKLDYISALGVDALWITSPVEQIHGWVAGGTGDFKYYAYAGYWAQDFTKIDANLGTAADLHALIDAAHTRGIRVLFDTVMNHPGYASGTDLLEYLPEVLKPGAPTTRDAMMAWQPAGGGNLNDWNNLVDYESNAWENWWGSRWIRAGFPGHNRPGSDDLKSSLAFLPDFMTEDFRPLPGIPVLFQRKTDTAVTAIPNATVRQYLVSWHSQWVREYGVDGFRCDTAKHVEPASWAALKTASQAALAEYKTQNPTKLDDLDFWMTGEVFGASVMRNPTYFDNGFDSLINFDFQGRAAQVSEDYAALEQLYSSYAGSINTDPTFNMLSYISSHDTSLYFAESGGSLSKQAKVGTALLLSPGGVQIYYGDESARPMGPSASDSKQGTRSDMNWNSTDPALLAHWQKVGTFRKRHRAVGAGAHQSIPFTGGYAFKRTYSAGGVDDAVVVVLLRQ